MRGTNADAHAESRGGTAAEEPQPTAGTLVAIDEMVAEEHGEQPSASVVVGAEEAVADNDGSAANEGSPANVSKHPEATIPESDLSLAEIERRRSHPGRWIAMIAVVLVAIVVPYWIGRRLAVTHTANLVALFSTLEPRAVAMVSWEATLVAFIGLAMMVVDTRKTGWFALFALGLAAEQLIAGVSLLKFSFWNSTYVMYGTEAPVANAANLGIMAAGVGLAVFAVVWVGLLVIIKKDSPLNFLTRSWVSFMLFLAFEILALCIVCFGGFISAA